jgi:DNA-binding CsgD family transcriptional regulator
MEAEPAAWTIALFGHRVPPQLRKQCRDHPQQRQSRSMIRQILGSAMQAATDEFIARRYFDRLRSRLVGQTERGVREAILRLLVLSPRELEVLSCLAEGNATKEVARILQISPRTVDAHSASIFQKLGASNRLDAVAIALRAGVLVDGSLVRVERSPSRPHYRPSPDQAE